MATDLIGMDRNNDSPHEPSWFGDLASSTQRVPVLLGTLGLDFHRLLEVGSEGCDENPFVGLDEMNAVPFTRAVLLEHGVGNGGAGRVADSPLSLS